MRNEAGTLLIIVMVTGAPCLKAEVKGANLGKGPDATVPLLITNRTNEHDELKSHDEKWDDATQDMMLRAENLFDDMDNSDLPAASVYETKDSASSVPQKTASSDEIKQK